jgi:hypothetical protein
LRLQPSISPALKGDCVTKVSTKAEHPPTFGKQFDSRAGA